MRGRRAGKSGHGAPAARCQLQAGRIRACAWRQVPACAGKCSYYPRVASSRRMPASILDLMKQIPLLLVTAVSWPGGCTGRCMRRESGERAMPGAMSSESRAGDRRRPLLGPSLARPSPSQSVPVHPQSVPVGPNPSPARPQPISGPSRAGVFKPTWRLKPPWARRRGSDETAILPSSARRGRLPRSSGHRCECPHARSMPVLMALQ